jgi:long-subunit fatty acid transport protein
MNGGVVLDPWGEHGVILSAGLFDRYDPRYDYWDERRTTSTSDEVVNNLVMETQSVMRSLTLGAAYPIRGGHGVGVALNYYYTSYSDRSALAPQVASSDFGENRINRSANGWSLTLGGVATLSERIRVGATLETEPQLSDDYEVWIDGDNITPDASNGDLNYPLRLQFGGTYQPRNEFRTTFAVDFVFTRWTHLKESIPDSITAELNSAWYPSGDLKDTWEVRFGLEHKFYNNLPARLGFRYGESYNLDEADRATFTAGVGYGVNQLTFGISGELTKINSRQDPVRPREEQGSAVGLGTDRVDDSQILVVLDAKYSF